MNVKITYASVHVDNYQGGNGRVIKEEALIDISDTLQSQFIMEECLSKLIKFLETEYYKPENITIIRIEILKEI